MNCSLKVAAEDDSGFKAVDKYFSRDESARSTCYGCTDEKISRDDYLCAF